MRTATVKEMPLEREIITEAWEMLKAYYFVDGKTTKQEWQGMLDRAEKLYLKGKGKPQEALALNIGLAIAEYISQLYTSRVQQKGNAGRQLEKPGNIVAHAPALQELQQRKQEQTAQMQSIFTRRYTPKARQG